MKIYYSSKFEKGYRKLSSSVKKKAEKREKIFRINPFAQQLKTHKLKGKLKDFYSFSIDYQHRIIFEFKNKSVVWFHSVGSHSIYG
jgi:mRNA-degrading endonuclease YafQ of YafQ-DinJ toxin-antitoxin module